jgi:vanillate O-demethylase monooxygenase subunit
MGDPALATSPPPSLTWMRSDPTWAYSRGYLNVASSYVYLHENLLDLSHLTFLHERTFGTPDYASAPYETEITDDRILVRRTVAPTRLPPIYAKPLGLIGVDAARIVTSTYISPGLSISAVVLRDLSKDEAQRQDHHIRTAQLVTPRDRDTVHYHFLVGRDFAIESEDTSHFILEAVRKAFAEDVYALENMTRIRIQDPDISFVEYSVPTDRAGVTLRRRLRNQAQAEHADSLPEANT